MHEIQTKNNIEEPEVSPLSEMIDQVQSYIDDPKLVTLETLTDLKQRLVDLQGFVEEDVEKEEPESTNSDEAPSIMIALGKAKKRGY